MEATEYTVGQKVCLTGRGMDAMIHRHATVVRLTKTQIVTKDQRGKERRYRRDSFASEIPYVRYGGTDIHPNCDRRDRAFS